MVVQQPQVQSPAQPQAAGPAAQASQIVGSGVQVRASGAEGFGTLAGACHLHTELGCRCSVVRGGSGWVGKAWGYSFLTGTLQTRAPQGAGS